MRTWVTLSCVVVALVIQAVQTAATADDGSKPYTFSNFRTISPDHSNEQFAWGRDSELFYVHRHPSGSFIYALNLSTNQTELIAEGTSPAFRGFTTFPDAQGGVDSLYFVRELGYSIDGKLWRYDHFLAMNVKGEHIVSSAVIRVASDIFLSPSVSPNDNNLTFVYRYAGSMAEGAFQQIRITRLKSDGRSEQTAILYSRGWGGPMPSISGWIDADTLVCFIENEPFLLRVNFSHLLGTDRNSADLRHYPDEKSGFLMRGLAGKDEVKLAASNFAPDGKSYLVYSSQKHSIIQKRLDGNVVGTTELPSGIRYDDPTIPPTFSRDGHYIAFIGRLDSVRTVYIADVN